MLKQIFLDSLKDTKDLIRKRIENTAEGTFEGERRKGYAEGALEFGEDIGSMEPNDKEALRLKCLRDLDDGRAAISSLWETMIDRTAYFQIEFEITLRLAFIVALICFIFSVYPIAAILGIVTIFLFVVSVVSGLFQIFMFIFTGLGHISDELLVSYYKYGRTEAALFFSDYRGYSHIGDKQKYWIYSTSHKNPPS